MSTLGIWLVGAAGNVAACTVAGWAGLRRSAMEPIGVLTETQPFCRLPLVDFDAAAFGGHEVRERTIASAVAGLVEERVLSAELADAVKDDIAAAQRDVVTGIAGELAGAAELEQVRLDLGAFRTRHQLSRMVVVNLATTEPPLTAELPATGDELLAAVKDGLALPPSMIYAAAAFETGCGYINFTPSPGASPAALADLAFRRAAVHAGADGKTGETLVKTALAPMFEARRLRVQSWFGQNVLGNNDGSALADTARRASKLQSKSAALESILGYQPDARVGIDYLKSYGDWKVAWNQIRFAGFGGAEMSMEFTWRGSDTSLAAPLCVDLIRLVELAMRRGERGALTYLAHFFKSPLGTDEHRLAEQYRMLASHYAGDLG